MRKYIFILWLVISTVLVGAAYNVNKSQMSAQAAVLGVAAPDHDTALALRSTELDQLAQLRADDMAQRGYYAHQTPDGKYFYDYLEKFGYSRSTSGCENLLLDRSGLSRQQVNQIWRASPKHLDCLNAAHTEFGYTEALFDQELELSVYVFVALTAVN